MKRRFPGLLLWVLLAAAIAVVPMACGGDDVDSGATDAAVKADSMTAG